MLKLKTANKRDVKTTKIKTIQFEKGSDNVKYTVSFNKNAKKDGAETSSNINSNLKKAYNEAIPICYKKLEKLLSLSISGIIKPEYHKEYNCLKSDPAVPDVLPDSDIEDPLPE